MNNTFAVGNGDAPLKNWAGSRADYSHSYYSKLNPGKVIEREERKYHCYSCVIGCGGICDISDLSAGRRAQPGVSGGSGGAGSAVAGTTGRLDPIFDKTHKPEYETTMVFGGLLMNKDLDSIFYINELLNRAGMDSISAGGTIAFAIECFEAGIISLADTGGIALSWGDSESVIALLKKMIAREGIGDLLADGSAVAARKLGKGSERFAVHAGGQELPMHDPKVDPMLGVTYSADPTPGRHTTSGDLYYSTSSLWKYVSWAPRLKFRLKADSREPTADNALRNTAQTCFKMLIDCSGSCYYAMLSGMKNYRIFDFLNAAAGWKKSPDELMEIGKRVQTLRQQFNAIQGVDPLTFRMNGRAGGEPPLSSGPSKGVSLQTEAMIPQYWEAWGWDGATGLPRPETLRALRIDELLDKEAAHAE
jgi:aldehyde:ferredoxin oxidoreductase